MESNNKYFIMVTIDWHRVARITYFDTYSSTKIVNQ